MICMGVYNIVSYNKSDMDNLRECVNVSINVSDKYFISVHDVTNVVLVHMSKGKTNGHKARAMF